MMDPKTRKAAVESAAALRRRVMETSVELCEGCGIAVYPEGIDPASPEAAGIEPLICDMGYYRPRKNGRWQCVDDPVLPIGAKLVDTHAHIHMLQEPGLALGRAACYNLRFVGLITDPTEDGTVVFDKLDYWRTEAGIHIRNLVRCCCGLPIPRVPRIRVSVGCHPHNARLFDDAAEEQLRALLAHESVGSLGEIGLDYHYDLSPRDVQRDVFRRQLRIAKEAGLPVALHVREAHGEALQILAEEGFPEAGCLLHCCSLNAEEIAPWVEAGCYIAYGGAVTFANAEGAREGARLVPADRILTETDSPYMAPVPLRGVTCNPDFVGFTMQKLFEVRGIEDASEQAEFVEQIRQNAYALLDRDLTPWQVEHAAQAQALLAGEDVR